VFSIISRSVETIIAESGVHGKGLLCEALSGADVQNMRHR
jgi:hypothetical protein